MVECCSYTAKVESSNLFPPTNTMAKSPTYLTTSNGYVITNDGVFLSVWFSKIPSTADMSFPKKIIYEVFDHYLLSKYIRSLAWIEGLSNDCIFKYFPVINWNYMADDDLFIKKDMLTGELIHILCTKWNKSTT